MMDFSSITVPRIIKMLIFILLEALIFFYMTKYLGGINLPDLNTTILIIVLLSLLNALLWPTLSYISLRFIVFTLGFGTFLIDGLLLYVISMFVQGVSIEGFALLMP